MNEAWDWLEKLLMMWPIWFPLVFLLFFVVSRIEGRIKSSKWTKLLLISGALLIFTILILSMKSYYETGLGMKIKKIFKSE